MAVSILEALQNAEYNMKNARTMGLGVLAIAERQLHNAIVLLEKGYDVNEEVEPLLDEYGEVENVPEA